MMTQHVNSIQLFTSIHAQPGLKAMVVHTYLVTAAF